jgi:hypothetical protein
MTNPTHPAGFVKSEIIIVPSKGATGDARAAAAP